MSSFPLFGNTKSVYNIMEEEGLRNILTLKRDQNRQNSSEPQHSTEKGLEEKGGVLGCRLLATSPTGSRANWGALTAVREWGRGHLQRGDKCLIRKTRLWALEVKCTVNNLEATVLAHIKEETKPISTMRFPPLLWWPAGSSSRSITLAPESQCPALLAGCTEAQVHLSGGIVFLSLIWTSEVGFLPPGRAPQRMLMSS